MASGGIQSRDVGADGSTTAEANSKRGSRGSCFEPNYSESPRRFRHKPGTGLVTQIGKERARTPLAHHQVEDPAPEGVGPSTNRIHRSRGAASAWCQELASVSRTSK